MSKNIRDDAKYFAIFRSAFIIFLKENWFLILKRTSLPFEKILPAERTIRKSCIFQMVVYLKKRVQAPPP